VKRLLMALAFCTAAVAQVKLPPYTREALPNGTVVYLLPRPGLPLVSFRVLVKGGAESEPAGLAGLTSITSELLRRGAGPRNAAQFNEELDGLGGTFGTNADEQSTLVFAEFLKKDFDRGLTLVADAALHPTFPEDEVRKAIARRLDALKAVKDSAGGSIGSFYRSFFFGSGHPYGRLPDESSLDRIRRADILDYHKRMYVGKNLIVIVAGDFDAGPAKTKVAATFGGLPPGTPYTWAADQPPARNNSPKLLLIDKPDATQTYFMIGQPGVKRASPDRVTLMLVNTLFGGRFTSLLNEELRTDTGLTYGANSRVEMTRLTGGIYISTYTKTETTEKAIDLALDILKRVHDKGITADQLTSAKTYVKGTFPAQQFQTADQIATVLGEMELYGLGKDEVDQFFARVDAVTLEQANDVIKRYYRTDNLTFVLLGNAAKIRDVAKKYSPKVDERRATQPGWGL
jgi:zinc protease